MVSVNFTLLVQLGLFLGFLWLMNAFVFRPLLRVMDQRDDSNAEKAARAEREIESARDLEKIYAQRLAEIHHDTNRKVAGELESAQSVHLAELERFKRDADAELHRTREAVNAELAAERERFPEITARLAQIMARQLGLKGVNGNGRG